MAKVKNYNLNVTEDRDSDFKNAFPGIFNFTVGILNIAIYMSFVSIAAPIYCFPELALR